jgi:hypothetical protein
VTQSTKYRVLPLRRLKFAAGRTDSAHERADDQLIAGLQGKRYGQWSGRQGYQQEKFQWHS